jgi:hypothetical protein
MPDHVFDNQIEISVPAIDNNSPIRKMEFDEFADSIGMSIDGKPNQIIVMTENGIRAKYLKITSGNTVIPVEYTDQP